MKFMSEKKRDCVLILGASVQKAGVGGVTIHTQRLCQWLSRKNYPYDFCDYKDTSLLTQVKEIKSHPLVHIHSSNPLITFFYVIASRLFRTKSILTIHGNLGRFSKWKNFLRQLSIRCCDTPILLNESSYRTALKWNKNSIKLAAFILPADDGELPDNVKQIIAKAKAEGKMVVATNAYKRVFDDSGNEIYGIDFLVNYFKSKRNYLLCISDPSGQYAETYADTHFENIVFISVPHSFYRLVSISDIMLRDTSTDGDSLSVKEGLSSRKKVIVTDCVDRPDGVILFKYNDSGSLSKALTTEIKTTTLEYEDVVESLVRLYDEMSSK
jgi:hypothetical protein